MSILSLIKSPSCAAGSAGLALLLFWLAIEPSLAMKKSSMHIQKTVTLPTGKDIGLMSSCIYGYDCFDPENPHATKYLYIGIAGDCSKRTWDHFANMRDFVEIGYAYKNSITDQSILLNYSVNHRGDPFDHDACLIANCYGKQLQLWYASIEASKLNDQEYADYMYWKPECNRVKPPATDNIAKPLKEGSWLGSKAVEKVAIDKNYICSPADLI